MGNDGLPGETDPRKGSLPPSTYLHAPPPYLSFRALRSDPGILCFCLPTASSEEESLDISVQRIRVLPPGVPEPCSIPDTGKPVGWAFPLLLKV